MNWDHKLFFRIHGQAHQKPWLDKFGFFCGRWLLYIYLLAFIIIVPLYVKNLGAFDNYLMPYLAVILGFCIAWICGYVVNIIIGLIVRRKRPYNNYKNKVKPLFVPLLGKWKSMPSDHAMTCAIIVVFWYFGLPWFPLYGFVIAVTVMLLIVWGRVFSGVHYPSDIIVGTIIGFLTPLVSTVIFILLSIIYNSIVL